MDGSPAGTNLANLTKLASQHTAELNKTLETLKTQEHDSLSTQEELDQFIWKVSGLPHGTPITDPTELLNIEGAMAPHLAHLLETHQSMVTLGQRVYQIIENQVQSIDKEVGAKKAAVADLQERLKKLGPAAAKARAHQGALVDNASMLDYLQPSATAGTSKAGRKAKQRPDATPASAQPPAQPKIPSIPAHYVPYTFNLPGREPFSEFVDPNEPVYCHCQQPSQGDMIACEGNTCKFEWFHYACVGINVEPDTWFCADCQREANEKPPKRQRKG